jgi:hypothetical protein
MIFPPKLYLPLDGREKCDPIVHILKFLVPKEPAKRGNLSGLGRNSQ